MNKSKTALGVAIARYRRKAGLTQKRLAEKLEIKFQRLGAWEEGRAKPPVDLLQKMAGVFEVSVDELLNTKGDEGSTDDHTGVEGQQGGGDQPGCVGRGTENGEEEE